MTTFRRPDASVKQTRPSYVPADQTERESLRETAERILAMERQKETALAFDRQRREASAATFQRQPVFNAIQEATGIPGAIRGAQTIGRGIAKAGELYRRNIAAPLVGGLLPTEPVYDDGRQISPFEPAKSERRIFGARQEEPIGRFPTFGEARDIGLRQPESRQLLGDLLLTAPIPGIGVTGVPTGAIKAGARGAVRGAKAGLEAAQEAAPAIGRTARELATSEAGAIGRISDNTLVETDASIKRLQQAIETAREAKADTSGLESTLGSFRAVRDAHVENALGPARFARYLEVQQELDDARAVLKATQEGTGAKPPLFGTPERAEYDAARRAASEAGRPPVNRLKQLADARAKVNRLQAEFNDLENAARKGPQKVSAEPPVSPAERIPAPAAQRGTLQTGMGIGEAPPQGGLFEGLQPGEKAAPLIDPEQLAAQQARRAEVARGQTEMFKPGAESAVARGGLEPAAPTGQARAPQGQPPAPPPPKRVPFYERGLVQEAGAPPPPRDPPTATGGLSEEPQLPSGRKPGGPTDKVPPPRDPYQQVQDALKPPERDPFLTRVRETLPQQFYDRNIILKDLERETGIPTHKLAQVVPGATTAGEDIVRRFYQPVIARVGRGNLASLEEYMTLKRMEDLLARNPSARLPGGVDGWQGVLKGQDTLKAKMGAERYSAIEQAASDLWRLNDEQNLKALVNEGILSPQSYTAIKAANPHYIPFQRADFVDDLSKSFDAPRGEASVSSTGIKKMELAGSERKLDQPLPRLLSEPIKTQEIIFRNRAAKGMVEALEALQKQTGDELVRYVEPKGQMRIAERVTGESRTIARKTESSALWEPVSFYKDGVKHTVEVPAEFGQVAKGLGAEPDSVLLNVIRKLNAPLRLGATTYNPFFMPVNVMRDAMAALFRENLVPFGPNYFAGLKSAIMKDATFTEAAQSGALMSGLIENMRGPTSALSRTRMGGIQVRSPKDALLLIPRAIEGANIIAERGVRLAAYRKFRAQGIDQLEAAVRTRDVTVDFAKSGHTMRVINQIIPFSNAATQGTANIVRTIKEHPIRSAAYGGLFATPTIMSRVNNMRYETSDLIPDYEYTRNWVIQYGEGTRKDGTKFPIYAKIPKGEIAGMFSFPAEALFNLARKSEDRSAVALLLEAGRDQAMAMSPIDPGLVPPVPFIQTGAGLATNTNLFTGAPIIPQREQGLLPEQQFGPETSKTAVALGRQFGISPRLIEFAINDMTAGAGQSLNWLLGLGMSALGYEPERFGGAVAEPEPTGVEAAAKIPGVRRFVGTRDTQLERRGWDKFDAAVEETSRAFSRLPDMNRLGIRLGSAPDSIDVTPGRAGGSIELTPEQRAQYQQIMADTVTPGMTQFLATLPATLTDAERKTVAQKKMDALKDQAREVAKRQIITPEMAGGSQRRRSFTGTSAQVPTATPVAQRRRSFAGAR